jgi:putative Mg2+ transporter-C (MgtC) family protein
MEAELITWTSILHAGSRTLELLVAAILGGLIGLERELRGKPAGIKTNALIAMGAALFTQMSEQLSGRVDAARISAQIVTGVGFIGAGMILRSPAGKVQGLTSAATVWAVAAVGLAVGGRAHVTAVAGTAAILFILVVINGVEKWTFGRLEHHCNDTVHVQDVPGAVQKLRQVMLEAAVEPNELRVHRDDRGWVVSYEHVGRSSEVELLHQQLAAVAEVIEVHHSKVKHF